MAALDYRAARPEDYEAVRLFLAEAGWGARVRDPQVFEKMMVGANRTVVAWEGGDDGERVIGFARALCDNVSNGYISMVAVTAARRGQGVGRELVRRLIGEDDGVTWVLRESRAFWERLGFAPSSLAMERPRTVRPES